MGAPIIDVDENLRLLGTAHVATASVEAVRENITEWQPDIVAVELCQSRYNALTQDRRLDKEGLLKVIKEGKAPMVLLQSLLAAEQRRLGIDEGQQPGAELLAAVTAAEESGLEVALVDRDIQTTLRRAWNKMGFREKFSLMWALIADDDSEEEIELEEMLADKDLLTSLMEELREVSPGAGEVLIDERDEYIARKISNVRSKGKVLAVLGAGHLDGVSKILNKRIEADEERISSLSVVPKGGRLLKTISYGIPLVLLGLLGWFAYNGDLDSIKENGIYWFAGNFIGAALFCMLAGGHPIAILVAALASPITSLNPALAAGWFAGYAQMKVKEPTGEDLTEFLKLDSAKLFWTNRAGRILLVTALTNLGSMAGAWISMGLIASGL
ncbi:MAG: TraB/GumN family protein [Euryarchaeota archaeon]|jgi:pheromone shutdown-related protein TraB|nr:TraB/GumN family protein [Euryarchaeota archaeon]MBT4981596.1 TraB/GumN family protein [Euryarchaeota archaeon]MBT5184139.1 TraB/GumN family protein [Euryarchaeota archaeon]